MKKLTNLVQQHKDLFSLEYLIYNTIRVAYLTAFNVTHSFLFSPIIAILGLSAGFATILYSLSHPLALIGAIIANVLWYNFFQSIVPNETKDFQFHYTLFGIFL